MLDSWSEGPTKLAIVDFVDRVTTPGTRISCRPRNGLRYSTTTARSGARSRPTFNWISWSADWPSKPWRTSRCGTNSHTKQRRWGDLSWFGDAVTKHYNGDDSALKVLAGGHSFPPIKDSPSNNMPSG